MKRSDWLIVLLIGVLVLIIAVPTGGVKEEKTTEIVSNENTEVLNRKEDYKEQLETELEHILSKISGVGNVNVMITLKNDGEDVLNKDISSDEGSYEESTIIYQQQDCEKPYVTSQIMPEVEGVVVVAQGAGNKTVVSNISDVVMALFDVELHKIKIVKMSV